MNMNEDLWKTLSSVNEWVQFSEGKAVALLAAQGVLIGLLSQGQLGQEQNLETAELTLGSIAVVLNALSMFYAFLCLNPRLKSSGGVSPLYFGSISSSFNSSNEYHDYYKDKMSDGASISKELCGQIFINSQIASKKYGNVAYSIRAFIASVFFWIAFVLFGLVC